MTKNTRKSRAPARRASRPERIDQNQAYSIDESAAALDISRCGIYELISAGKLKPLKFGRRTRISGSQIIAIVQGLA